MTDLLAVAALALCYLALGVVIMAAFRWLDEQESGR